MKHKAIKATVQPTERETDFDKWKEYLKLEILTLVLKNGNEYNRFSMNGLPTLDRL